MQDRVGEDIIGVFIKGQAVGKELAVLIKFWIFIARTASFRAVDISKWIMYNVVIKSKSPNRYITAAELPLARDIRFIAVIFQHIDKCFLTQVQDAPLR